MSRLLLHWLAVKRRLACRARRVRASEGWHGLSKQPLATAMPISPSPTACMTSYRGVGFAVGQTNTMCDWSVCIEAPDHGLARDVNMHDDFVAHELDEQHRAPDDIVRVGVRAPVQNVFGSDAKLDVFVGVEFHFVSLVRW